MNFILAALLLAIGFMIGSPFAVQSPDELPAGSTFSDRQVAIIRVVENSAAAQAGILSSDIVQSVNGQQFDNVPAFQNFVNVNKGQEMKFVVKRVNEEKTIVVKTKSEVADGEGVLGVNLALYGKLKFEPLVAIGQGFVTAYQQLGNIATGLYNLFSKGDGLESLGGPVKIAQLTGQVADMGIIYLIQFAAFLSLNLALLNALPIPALDGGRILFLIIEKVRGKRNNQKLEQYANAIGFMALLLLMLVITVRDVSQLETIKNLFS